MNKSGPNRNYNNWGLANATRSPFDCVANMQIGLLFRPRINNYDISLGNQGKIPRNQDFMTLSLSQNLWNKTVSTQLLLYSLRVCKRPVELIYHGNKKCSFEDMRFKQMIL